MKKELVDFTVFSSDSVLKFPLLVMNNFEAVLNMSNLCSSGC